MVASVCSVGVVGVYGLVLGLKFRLGCVYLSDVKLCGVTGTERGSPPVQFSVAGGNV